MTFPEDVLGLTVELLISGVWTAITSLVRGKDNLTVTRGRSSEGTKVDPSKGKLTANNRDGNLSPRNPTGTYYGLIGRNTRMRARLFPSSESYLYEPLPFDNVSTPDSSSTSITGDIDIRLDVQPATWDAGQGLAGKYEPSGNQRSWALWVNADGTLTLRWSNDGTTQLTATSTAAVTVPDSGRLAVRATLDVNNGAAGKDVKFYTAPTMADSFVQLGATVTTAGTTSIFNSTADTVLGYVNSADAGGELVGRIYAFQLYDGIAGTLIIDMDMDDYDAGDTSLLVITNGSTWTLGNVDDDATTTSSIVDPSVRFHGEVSEWPQRWDTSGTDVYVPLEASGILRRLTQGASPLKSTLYRALTTLANPPRAYWPCEDDDGATELASALGGPPMRISGTPDLASDSGFASSSPIPLLSSSEWSGLVPSYTGTGDISVFFLLHATSGGATGPKTLCSVYTTGTIQRWDVVYLTGGDFEVKAYDGNGTEVENGTLGFAVNGKLLRVTVRMEQVGADVDWSFETLEVGAPSVGGTGATIAGQTVSRVTKIVVNPGGGLDDFAIGHVSAHDDIVFLSGLSSELNAYGPFGLQPGESAGRRIQRLCGEEGVAFRAIGDLDATAAMGPQLPAELATLLQDAADADLGILYEPRDLFGLAYRTRESLYRQDAALALDYSLAHLSGIDPVDDDQATRNDITAKRAGGSSFRVVSDTGPLSVLAPPDGVGRYDTAPTLNLATDSQLPDMAGWLLHLGTVDEARHPVLSVDLARQPFVDDGDLAAAAQDLDLGDRLTVANPPAWLPPDTISQLAQGLTETMSNFTHRIDVNCSPETPWGQPAVYDDGVSRYSSDGTTLAEDLDTTETGVDVSTPSGPVWTHVDSNFLIRVGGETMWVTAVSGAGASQTLTVTRSANGVVKSHSSGAAVSLDQPSVYVP